MLENNSVLIKEKMNKKIFLTEHYYFLNFYEF